MRLYITKTNDAYLNLAIEETLFKDQNTKEDLLMIYRNSGAVISGKNQNIYEEVNSDFTKKNDLQVVRRISGGGTVFQDLGNVNFGAISIDGKEESYEFFTKPIIEFLKSIGVEAYFHGKNDILVDGKKISGNAQSRYKNRFLHHGTLLFNCNFEAMIKSLNVNRDKMISKGIKSISQHVTNIRDHVKSEMNVDQFVEELSNFLVKKYDAKLTKIPEKIMKKAQALAKERSSWNWVYGSHANTYEMEHSERFKFGTLKVKMTTKKGVIKNIKFEGDFMSLADIEKVENKLQNVRLKENELCETLEQFNLKDYFGGITINEIVKVILG